MAHYWQIIGGLNRKLPVKISVPQELASILPTKCSIWVLIKKPISSSNNCLPIGSEIFSNEMYESANGLLWCSVVLSN